MRWKSAIMPSIWATLRRFSSTWNFFRRISVSRDFIDSYSPEVPICKRDRPGIPQGPHRHGYLCGADDGLTKLAFRFQTSEDLLKLPVTGIQAGHLVFGLAQKALERLMQPDRLVDLGARAPSIGPKPDQFLHVGIGCHHLTHSCDGRQIGRIGRFRGRAGTP